MSPLVISVIVFASVFGGAPYGLFLRTRLPEHHLSPETNETRDLLPPCPALSS